MGGVLTPAALLAAARAAGFRLGLDADRLTIHGPADRIDLGRALRTREAEILDLLDAELAGPWPTATVSIWIDGDGQICSGPLCDGFGQPLPDSGTIPSCPPPLVTASAPASVASSASPAAARSSASSS